MLKWLIFGGLFLLFVLGLRSLGGGRSRREADHPVPPTPPQPTRPENMVRCVHCGVHLPQGQSLPGRGGVYCGAAHRALAEARTDGPQA